MQLKQNNVIVKPLGGEALSKGGIYIPDYLIEKRNRGIVTHIGTNVDPEILGKEVLFVLEAAQNFSHETITGKLIFETDIIATLN